VLLLLMLAFAFNFVDRQVLSVALESIKRDLALSDTQLGLVTGAGFAICYSLVGLPIARLADRTDRGRIIWVSLLLLSLTSALTGMVSSFSQLLAVRLGAGAGEAGVVPAAHSLIASLYARWERPRAMSVLLIGGPLSLMLGYAAGGWMVQSLGWRPAFLILAIPGALLALCLHMVKGDPRTATTAKVTTGVETGSMASLSITIRTLLARPTFRWLLVAYSADSLFGTGLVQWLPVFLIRSHHMAVEQAGLVMAMSWGLAGALGTFLGGHIIGNRSSGFEGRQLSLMCASAIGYMLLNLIALLSGWTAVVIATLAAAASVYALANAPSFSLIQSLAPENMRATAVAAVFLLGNLVGLGMGPLTVGLISDWLHASAGADSVRYALAVSTPGYLMVAGCYILAGKTVAADLRAAEAAVLA
jgi:MFS family permease